MIEVVTDDGIKIEKPEDGSGDPWRADLPDGRVLLVLPDVEDARIARRHRAKPNSNQPPTMALYARLGGVYLWLKGNALVLTTRDRYGP